MPINNKAYDLHEEALSSEILEEIKIQFRCLTFTCQEFVVPLFVLLEETALSKSKILKYI